MKTGTAIFTALLAFISLGLNNCTLEEIPDSVITFEHVIPGRGVAESVVVTSDDGYAVLSNVYDSQGNSDIRISKFDKRGDTIFSAPINLSTNDFGKDFLQTNDGGFLIVGNRKGTVVDELAFIRTNALGTPVSTPPVEQNGEAKHGRAIIPTADGQFLIVGNVLHNGKYDVLLLKVDVDGNVLDKNTLDELTNNEFGEDVVELPGGAFGIAGNYSSNSKSSGAFYLRVDAGLEFIPGSYRTFGDDLESGFSSISSNGNGEVLLAGYIKQTINGVTNDNFYVVKSSGSDFSEIPYGENSDDYAYEAIFAEDGGIVIAGTLNQNGCLLKLKRDDSEDFIRPFDQSGFEVFNACRQTSDLGFIMCGGSNSALYVVKTDSRGIKN